MKNSIYLKSLLLLTIILIVSCREITVTTTINTDGSCERVIVVRTDSINFFEKEYPVPVDTTWELSVEPDTAEKGKFFYKARKTFKTVAELNELYATDTGYLSKLKRSVELEKRFRWFYTFFTYKEVYKKMFDQPSLPTYLDEKQEHFFNLSVEEQKAYLQEMNDTIKAEKFKESIDEQFGIWVYQTLFNEYYHVFEKEITKLNDSSLSPKMLKSYRDSLNVFIVDANFPASSDEFLEIASCVFKTDVIHQIKNDIYNPFKEIDEKAEMLDEMFTNNNYTNNIAMPGIIMETNAEIVSADSIVWEVSWDKFLTDDYKMIVESRTLNKWAFWVSSCILFIIGLALIVRFSNKRK